MESRKWQNAQPGALLKQNSEVTFSVLFTDLIHMLSLQSLQFILMSEKTPLRHRSVNICRKIIL